MAYWQASGLIGREIRYLDTIHATLTFSISFIQQVNALIRNVG